MKRKAFLLTSAAATATLGMSAILPNVASAAEFGESTNEPSSQIPQTIERALRFGSSVTIVGPNYTVDVVRAMVTLARSERAMVTITGAGRYPETDIEIISSAGRRNVTWDFSR